MQKLERNRQAARLVAASEQHADGFVVPLVLTHAATEWCTGKLVGRLSFSEALIVKTDAKHLRLVALSVGKSRPLKLAARGCDSAMVFAGGNLVGWLRQ
eukprot:6276098-Amphidinium_carterae.1